MSFQIDKDQAFNFFRQKNIVVTKDSEKFTRYCAMFLFTMQKIFTPKTLAIGFLGISAIIFSYNYMSYSDVEKQQKQLELITQEKNLLQEKKQLAQDEKAKADKEEQKDIVMDQGRYNLIKTIPSEVIRNTVSYIDVIQAQEIKKLNTLYWSMVYINENESTLKMDVVNSEIQKSIFELKSHYSSRKKDILTTYALVQTGDYKSIGRTYDNSSSAEVLLNWVSYQSSKSEIYQPATEQKYAEWMKNLKKPQDLAEYLAKNQHIIETTGFIK